MFRNALFPPPPTIAMNKAEVTSRRIIKWKDANKEDIQNAINNSTADKAFEPDSLNFKCIQKAYTAI